MQYHAIIKRIQAQLTEPQARRLRELAHDEGVSVAELLRRGADLVLEGRSAPGWEERKRRALAAVGRFEGEADDVSVEHDSYLEEAYRG